MRNHLFLPLLILFSFLRVMRAFAGVEQLSEAEFRALAKEIAPKVNLFRDVWATDPKAEFYGGTSRDYLYWLKGKFREAKTREEAQKIAQALKSRGSIDIREFIIGGSDIDIISHAPLSIDPARYGVRKIDIHGANYFDPASETWKNELNQGHIPAEKIRLGATGTIPVPELGDGVKEIYQGKLSVQFADPKVFAATKYAKEKLNHPILLALRYLRLQAMNYYQEQGAGLPDKKILFNGMDEASRAAVKKVISDSTASRELKPYLEQSRFKSWINGTIQKSFLSYTNQTAALELMREFGVDGLHAAYPDIEPINQYVFQQYRDEKAIESSLKKYGVDKANFYQPPERFFPDGQLYHGTKSEPAFRSIIFQGALNSEDGSAGAGLYGVSQADKEFSENWGGDKDRLLRFPVKSDAKIVDITTGEGKRIFRKFGGDHEAFAREFGVDIIRYPYEADAYVVKNGAALGRAQGVYRELLHFDEVVDRLAKSKTIEERIGLLKLNSLSREDLDLLHRKFPKLSAEVLEWLLARRKPKAKRAPSQPPVTGTGRKRQAPVVEATEEIAGHSAILSIAKNEMYRLAATNDPATLERLAKATRPLGLEVVRSVLDAPDPLLGKISEELAKEITSRRHPIFAENFLDLFLDPRSTRLAPLLDKFLQHADHSQRYKFAKMFTLPHMVALEDQMLTMLQMQESNVHDQLADHVFTHSAGLKYPKGFEAWLNTSRAVSGNFEYYVEQLLAAPHLKQNMPYMELVVRKLANIFPNEIADFLSRLPEETLAALYPLALENVPEKNKYSFMASVFRGRPVITKAEKKIIWETWQSTPLSQQHLFAHLVIPQIGELPVGERGDYYRRLLKGKDAVTEVARYFLTQPPDQRPKELWDLIRAQLSEPHLLKSLSYLGGFVAGSAERDIMEAVAAMPAKSREPLRYENLRGLVLPRDRDLVLNLMQNTSGSAILNLISEALENPQAVDCEEVALKILRNHPQLGDLGIGKVLMMPHAKNWTAAQLLFLEKAHGWKPNAAQLAQLQTPDGKEKLHAAVVENKYGWQKKLFLNRHFPPSGQAVGRIKGFMMDCAAGFAKFR